MDPITILTIFVLVPLVVGIALWASKRYASVGKALAFVGVGGLAALGLYTASSAAGIYGALGPAGGWAGNIIGLVLVIVGLAFGIYAIRRVR